MVSFGWLQPPDGRCCERETEGGRERGGGFCFGSYPPTPPLPAQQSPLLVPGLGHALGIPLGLLALPSARAVLEPQRTGFPPLYFSLFKKTFCLDTIVDLQHLQEIIRRALVNVARGFPRW